MFDEDNTFENDIQISDNIIGGVNPTKQQYQKFKNINKKEKTNTFTKIIEEKAKSETERIRKEAKAKEQKIKKINLLKSIDINKNITTLHNYYDILEKLDDFLYQDIDFFNILESKIDQLLPFENPLYEQLDTDIKKSSSIFDDTRAKFNTLERNLNKYNSKFGISKNNEKNFETMLSKFKNIVNDEKIKELIGKINTVEDHFFTLQNNKLNSINKNKNTYLLNDNEIIEKFNSVFLSEVFKNDENNIPETTQQFIEEYIGLNNLTNDFYIVIDFHCMFCLIV